MRGIDKVFPGVHALQNVDFTLCEGEIHALMGENGAGKSTLIKVLTGVYTKDEGEIILNDNAVSIKSPQDAQNLPEPSVGVRLRFFGFSALFDQCGNKS